VKKLSAVTTQRNVPVFKRNSACFVLRRPER